ncbi:MULTISPECIES: 30S ribosomal protein S17 [Ureaplasma]|uniref:Small ribosomal subunit protein uS17 n=2 Tax=Ureaplasma TaxID=2129 RepID=A0ABT3BP44_9BACT|nr:MULTISPECIES: 30S ribosomal protein S17 [Ureaplasma]MCV3728405.1 30S ribosomal protein S17 [Ureaplasma miroungigenitalium]MCV3734192.1 30S ribosomal protein S17 [Ureaplasma miroungigenitalium]MCV3743613.1 30S ribosomal protein S17 [Ureaplasma sp. ES3154-GEN]MCV3753882.1 30S ribosomal protein S17 [Ureaplasma zalophigenitalium]
MVRNSHRKVLEGVVTSDKMQKTVTVSVESKSLHPIYKKLVISHKKYHAHNENDDAKMGDRVQITETRKLSATKNWRVSKILERAR